MGHCAHTQGCTASRLCHLGTVPSHQRQHAPLLVRPACFTCTVRRLLPWRCAVHYFVDQWTKHSTLLLISVLAQSLTAASDLVTAKALADALTHPSDLPSLVTNLQQLATCKHTTNDDRADRLKKVAKQLADATPETALSKLLGVVSKWHAADLNGSGQKCSAARQEHSHPISATFAQPPQSTATPVLGAAMGGT